jgi:hypothetical protein
MSAASRSNIFYRTFPVKIDKTVILPVVLCGYDSWSLALREECRLSVFDSWVLRMKLGPKVLSNKWPENSAYGGASLFKLVATYYSGYQIKDEMGGAYGTHSRKEKF